MSRGIVRMLAAGLSFGLVWSLGMLRAADDDGETDLELMRLQFARSLIAGSLQPLKQHMDELLVLERSLAKQRDYRGAIEAQQQRRRIESQLEREDKELLLLETREQSLRASLLPEVIEMPLEEAKLKGLSRPSGGGVIEGWSNPGVAAEWVLPDLPPGGYEVYLRYRCGTVEGGSLLVEESRFTLTGRIETTMKGPERRLLGTLKVTDGDGPFRLVAKTLVKDNLMQLLGVELVPASR